MLAVLYRSLVVSLLCHCLIGRASRRGLFNVVLFVGFLERTDY